MVDLKQILDGITVESVKGAVGNLAEGVREGVAELFSQPGGLSVVTIKAAVESPKLIAKLQAELANNGELSGDERDARQKAIDVMDAQLKVLATDGVLWNVPGEKDGKHPALREYERTNTTWLNKNFVGAHEGGTKWTQAEIDADRAARAAAVAEAEARQKIERPILEAEKRIKETDAELARMREEIKNGPTPGFGELTEKFANGVGNTLVAGSKHIDPKAGDMAQGAVDAVKNIAGLAKNTFNSFSGGTKSFLGGIAGAFVAAFAANNILPSLPFGVGSFFGNGMVKFATSILALFLGFFAARGFVEKNYPPTSDPVVGITKTASIAPTSSTTLRSSVTGQEFNVPSTNGAPAQDYEGGLPEKRTASLDPSKENLPGALSKGIEAVDPKNLGGSFGGQGSDANIDATRAFAPANQNVEDKPFNLAAISHNGSQRPSFGFGSSVSFATPSLAAP